MDSSASVLPTAMERPRLFSVARPSLAAPTRNHTTSLVARTPSAIHNGNDNDIELCDKWRPDSSQDNIAELPDPVKDKWNLGYLPSYMLTAEAVNDFLTRKFGNHNFHIHSQSDKYAFWTPRDLLEEEIFEILNYRLASTALESTVVRATWRNRLKQVGNQALDSAIEPEGTLPLAQNDILYYNTSVPSDPSHPPVEIGIITALPLEVSLTSVPRSCRLCRVVYCLWFLLAFSSLAVGIWRSIITEDEGKGFTDAAYVVAVGGLILYPIQHRHSRNCVQNSNEG